MKLKSKIIGINVFAQAMFAVIFLGGLYVSYNSLTGKLHYSSLIERYSEDALDTYLIVHLAESGDVVGVKESLNMKLDNYVYEIHGLIEEDADSKVEKNARGILRRIAVHRKAFPREAKNLLQREVDEILQKYGVK